MKRLFVVVLVTVPVLLSGCFPTQQNTEREPPQPQNQQPANEIKVFHVSPEEVSYMMVGTVLGPRRMTAFKPRKATSEETENIIKWYNSITEYKVKTCCPEDNGTDANIRIYTKRGDHDVVFISIGLYGDQLAADGRDGQAYWVEQPELKAYLKTVQ